MNAAEKSLMRHSNLTSFICYHIHHLQESQRQKENIEYFLAHTWMEKTGEKNISWGET